MSNLLIRTIYHIRRIKHTGLIQRLLSQVENTPYLLQNAKNNSSLNKDLNTTDEIEKQIAKATKKVKDIEKIFATYSTESWDKDRNGNVGVLNIFSIQELK